MRIVYTGPFVEGVYHDLPDGTSIEFTPGDAREVSDQLGRLLLEQPANFRADEPVPKRTTPPRDRAAEKEE